MKTILGLGSNIYRGVCRLFILSVSLRFPGHEGLSNFVTRHCFVIVTFQALIFCDLILFVCRVVPFHEL